MGMPVKIEIVDAHASQSEIDKIFGYFKYIDETFSTYKDTSEMMAINRGELRVEDASEDMRTIFALAEETKTLTNGYFDIKRPGGNLKEIEKRSKGNPEGDYYDPSGIVKGWAIWRAAKILGRDGFKNFYVDAGGDVEVAGSPERNKKRLNLPIERFNRWSVGIRNPFKQDEIVKTLHVTDAGVATSGTYVRGDHIYNPKAAHSDTDGKLADEIVSLTVIGPNIYEADRFATAAFAMGAAGINFIEKLDGFEGYMIDKKGIATMTSGLEKYA